MRKVLSIFLFFHCEQLPRHQSHRLHLLGYKYNPDHDEPVDQTYLPSELQEQRFWRPDEEPTRPARPPAAAKGKGLSSPSLFEQG